MGPTYPVRFWFNESRMGSEIHTFKNMSKLIWHVSLEVTGMGGGWVTVGT